MFFLYSPTRLTCNTFSLTTDYTDNFSRERERELITTTYIIDKGLFNHQLIYCTRKFSKAMTHKQITSRSLNNYTAAAYKGAMSEVYFPDYENFGDARSNSIKRDIRE